MADLSHLVDKPISVITADGRNIVGVLKGYDQYQNLVIESCQERVISPSDAMTQETLGLYIVRGENIAVIGQVDSDLDEAIEWGEVHGEPLQIVRH